MSKSKKCTVCAYQVDSGVVVDTSRSNVAWAKQIGVSEASVRRHFKHAPESRVGVDESSYRETWTGVEGELAVVIRGEEITKEAILRKFGHDPDKVSIVGTLEETHWMMGGEWQHRYRFKTARRQDDEVIDLPALYAEVSKPRTVPQPLSTARATVVVWSDPQIGKVARRGDTEALIERSEVVRADLSELFADRAPEAILIADGGDGIEGFESGGNPMFTNDLSLAGQLDLYSTELFRFIDVAYSFAPVTVASVPSNHAAWRNGKQQLGKPGDDLGIFTHKQVRKITDAAGMAIDWVLPNEYDESVAVEFFGTTIGLVHGNQFGPGQAVSWWEKQTFGAQAVSQADILVHGHYHSFSANVAGRNPVNQRQRWCLGAPTLDNGSDWFRQRAGRDSDPGVLVFDVTEDGFDLSSLTIL